MNRHDRAFECCGVRIDALDRDVAAELVVQLAAQRQRAAIHLCNAFTLSIASSSGAFRSLLNRGDLNFPDGMPLVWIARRLGIPVAGRVYGPDLLLDVADRGRSIGLRHLFYGSNEDVLHDLATALIKRFPGLSVAETLAPPFRELADADDELLINAVRRSGASIVWVGLGTPKQDVWMDRVTARLNVPLVAVGAAFDFHAGRTRQAPEMLQRLGLEWAFRLAVEPRRLWRRYLIGNAKFIAGLVSHRPRRLGATGS